MTTAAPTGQVTEARAALRAAWQAERQAAAAAERAGDGAGAWHHLQRAHILSQPRTGLHLRPHGAMLATAIRRRERRETLGQLVRLVLAVPGSLTGRYPVGNTGSANVSAFSPMAVPEDLRPLLLALGGAA